MEKKWWHGKAAYQIYPKSFCDSNGDGIGDLEGIISKLDYLKDLGIDIIWLSPVYQSPMADQGYDISDYYSIDPIFGNMEQMDRLLKETKKRGMYLVMDLVANHCSDEHIWFKKACEDPDGKYGKYFYIQDWHEGEPLPCNLRSYFGGPVWDKLPGHDDKIYLHFYHKKQPDLNWENPEVRQELNTMINWWLDKGLAGFRLDAICNIKKKLPFCNYPADRSDGLCSVDRMLEDVTTELIGALDTLADNTFRKYNAFTVGEVFTDDHSDLPLYIGDKGVFSSVFDFSETLINHNEVGWYTWKPVEAEQYKAACFDSQKCAENVGMFSNIIENHDFPRGVSRFLKDEDRCEASKKMLAGLNMMLKGLPFIYQGQEIGMENCGYSHISQADDIYALGEYQTCLDAGLSPQEALAVTNQFTRDNARTPVQWNAQENAGFTTGKPWLPVNPNYKTINVAEQMGRPDSLWNFYRALIALRKNPQYRETVVYGATEPYLKDQHNLMAYHRKGKALLLVMGNYQREPQQAVIPGRIKKVLINNMDPLAQDGSSITLEGYQFVVMELEKSSGKENNEQ